MYLYLGDEGGQNFQEMQPANSHGRTLWKFQFEDSISLSPLPSFTNPKFGGKFENLLGSVERRERLFEINFFICFLLSAVDTGYEYRRYHRHYYIIYNLSVRNDEES